MLWKWGELLRVSVRVGVVARGCKKDGGSLRACAAAEISVLWLSTPTIRLWNKAFVWTLLLPVPEYYIGVRSSRLGPTAIDSVSKRENNGWLHGQPAKGKDGGQGVCDTNARRKRLLTADS